MQNVLRSNNFLGSLPYSTPSFSIFPLLSNVVITYQRIQHICIVFHQGVTIFYLIYGTLFTLNNIKLLRFIERLYMFLKVITNEKWDVTPWLFPDRCKALFHYIIVWLSTLSKINVKKHILSIKFLLQFV